jgi:hypothetical protein
VLLLAVIFANMLFVELRVGRGRGPTALKVALALDFSDPVPSDSVLVIALDRSGNAEWIPRGKTQWIQEGKFVSNLRLGLPPHGEQSIQRVRVSIGDREFAFPRDSFFVAWKRAAADSFSTLYELPVSVRGESPAVPYLRSVINWPGDGRIIRLMLGSSIRAFALCLLLILVARQFVPFPGSSQALEVRFPVAAGVVPVLCVAFAGAYAVTYLYLAGFDDMVNPRGDAWEYQAMAVNAARGHGINRLGSLEPIESYRFLSDDRDTTDYQALMAKDAGMFWAYRTPGYPGFLAGLYAAFGVSPAKAKQAQLLLLVVVAAFLPFLGFHYWKAPGFYGGLIAGVLFLESWHEIAGRLYTESLTAIAVFGFIAAVLFYENRRSVYGSALLGVISGIALLVKGDLIFLPIITLAFLVFRAWKKSIPLSHAIVFAAMSIATVAPWSVYASRHTGQTVVLSTQGSGVLLDGNNEYALEDGGWHPEYQMQPGAFYNRIDVRDSPAMVKILRFYATWPGKLPSVISLKLNAGFGSYMYLRLASFLIMLMLVGNLIGTRAPAHGDNLKKPGYAIAGYGVASIALLLLVLNVAVMLIACFSVVVLARFINRRDAFSLPTSFVIVVGNFILITLAAFGDPRFISVIDGLFMLTAMTLLLSLLVRLFFPEGAVDVFRKSV